MVVSSLPRNGVSAKHPLPLVGRRGCQPHQSSSRPPAGCTKHSRCNSFPVSPSKLWLLTSAIPADSLSPNAMHSVTSLWYAQTYSSAQLSSRYRKIFRNRSPVVTNTLHHLRAELQVGTVHRSTLMYMISSDARCASFTELPS